VGLDPKESVQSCLLTVMAANTEIREPTQRTIAAHEIALREIWRDEAFTKVLRTENSLPLLRRGLMRIDFH
jgi:hypothetical protein